MISKFTAKINANPNDFIRKINQVQKEVLKLQDEITVKINANVNDAIVDIEKVQRLAEQLDGKKADLNVDADVLSAVTQLERAKRAVDDLRNNMNKINIKIRANVHQFFSELRRIQVELIKVKQDSNVVEIKANITDFMRDILQVRTLAQDIEKLDIKIKVQLNNKVLGDISKLLYELDVLERKKIKIPVELDMSIFYTHIAMVNAEIQALQRNAINIDVKLNTAQFGMDIAAIQALLAGLGSQTANINLKIDMSDVIRALNEIKLAILSLRDVTVDIRADIRNFLAGAAVVQRVSNRLRNQNIVVKIWTDFTNAMQAYAVVVRAFAEAGQQMLGGTVLALIPTLVPIVSVLIGLIGHMGVMLGVAATSAFALVTALGAATIAAGAFAAVAIPTIKTLFDENAKLTKQQQEAKRSFDEFKNTYDRLVKATEQPVLDAFTSAMNAANRILQQLEPLFLSSADAVAGLMDSLNQSIDSQPIQDFFAFLNQDGAGLLTTIGESVGYLVQGLLNMMTAFAPLAKQTADGFRNMSKGFAEWANGLSKSDRFAALMAYVNEYMPIMRKAFKDLTVGIIEFFGAFGGQSRGFIQGFADMMAAFREWASSLGENEQFQRFLAYIKESTPAVLTLIGNLWQTLIGLGVAMAPIAAHIMNVVNGFLQWFSAGLQAEGILAKIVGLLPVLVGVISALVPVVISITSIFGNITKAIITVLPHFSNLTNFVVALIRVIGQMWTILSKVGAFLSWFATPIGIVVTAITVLIAAFILAYNKVDWFRQMCDETWNHTKTVASRVFGQIADIIKKIFDTIVKIVSTAITLLKNFWDKFGDEIVFIARIFATALQGVIQGLMTLLFGIIEGGLKIITGAFSVAWDLISGVVSVFIDLLVGIVQAGMKLLQGDWEGAWNIIVSTTESIANTIVTTLSNIIGTVTRIGSDIISGLVNGISSGFDWVKAKVAELANFIPEWLKGPLGIHSPSRTMAAVSKWIPAGVAKGILDNINMVKTASQKMANAVTVDFSANVNKTTGTYKTLMSNIETINKQMAKKTQTDRYEALSQSLSDMKQYHDVSAAYEYDYWQEIAKTMKDGTGIKNTVLANANKAYAQMMQEQYDKETHFMDQMTKYNVYSLRERIQAYEEYMKNYEIGSAQQIAYEEKIYDAKQQLYTDLTSIAEDYLAKVQDVYKKLADEEQNLRDEFQRTFEARRDTLANTWGLFDEVKLTEMITFKDDGSIDKQINLLDNMRQQVSTLSSWMDDLSMLTQRGIDAGLLNELQALGPKAAAEISTLVRMSNSELTEYQSLWRTKMELAGKQATAELAGARAEMELQITKLRENAALELEKMKVDMLKEINRIVNGSTSAFNVLTATLPEIGKSAMGGLISAVQSMGGTLQSTVRAIANDVSSAMSEILMGMEYSAAAVSVSADSLRTSATLNVNQNANTAASTPQPVNVNIDLGWNGQDVLAYVQKEQATQTKLTMRKK